MKKILLIMVTLIGLVGCISKKQNIPKNTQKDLGQMSVEELDTYFDSINAEGFACIVRGSDREYDTIIDHVRYRYVKDVGYDTPIDSNKHCKTN